MVVDATSVYWINQIDGALMQVPLGGGIPTMLAVATQPDGSIAVNTTSVYWTQVGGVWKTPLGGGTSTMIASRQQGHGAVAVRGTSVYWLDNPQLPF
jgi:hypothetical protein